MFRGAREFNRRQDTLTKTSSKTRAQLLDEARREREQRSKNKKLEGAALIIQAAYRSHRVRIKAREEVRLEWHAEFSKHAKLVTQEAQLQKQLELPTQTDQQKLTLNNEQEAVNELFRTFLRNQSPLTAGERLISLLRKFFFFMDPRKKDDLDKFRVLCKLLLIDLRTATNSSAVARGALQSRFLGSIYGLASTLKLPKESNDLMLEGARQPSTMSRIAASVSLTSPQQWSAFVLLRVTLKMCFILVASGHLMLGSDQVSVLSELPLEILALSTNRVEEIFKNTLPPNAQCKKQSSKSIIPYPITGSESKEQPDSYCFAPEAYRGFHLLLSSHLIRFHPGDSSNDSMLSARYRMDSEPLDISHINKIHILQSLLQRPVTIAAVLCQNPLASPFALPGICSQNQFEPEVNRVGSLVDSAVLLYPSPRKPLLSAGQDNLVASSQKRKAFWTTTELSLGLDLRCPSLHKNSLAQTDPCTFGGVTYLARQAMLQHLRVKYCVADTFKDARSDFPLEVDLLRVPYNCVSPLTHQNLNDEQSKNLSNQLSAMSLFSAVWKSSDTPSQVWKSILKEIEGDTPHGSVISLTEMSHQIGWLLATHQYLIDVVTLAQFFTTPLFIARVLAHETYLRAHASSFSDGFCFTSYFPESMKKRFLMRLANICSNALNSEIGKINLKGDEVRKIELPLFLTDGERLLKTKQHALSYYKLASQLPLCLVSSSWNESIPTTPLKVTDNDSMTTSNSNKELCFNMKQPCILRPSKYFVSLPEVFMKENEVATLTHPSITANPTRGGQESAEVALSGTISRLSSSIFVHSLAHPTSCKSLIYKPYSEEYSNWEDILSEFSHYAPNSYAKQLVSSVSSSSSAVLGSPLSPSSLTFHSGGMQYLSKLVLSNMQYGTCFGSPVSREALSQHFLTSLHQHDSFISTGLASTWSLARIGYGMEVDLLAASHSIVCGIRYAEFVKRASGSLKRDALGFVAQNEEISDNRKNLQGTSKNFQMMHEMPNLPLLDILTIQPGSNEDSIQLSVLPQKENASIDAIKELHGQMNDKWNELCKISFPKMSSGTSGSLRDVDRIQIRSSLGRFSDISNALIARAQTDATVHVVNNVTLMLSVTCSEETVKTCLLTKMFETAISQNNDIENVVKLQYSDVASLGHLFTACTFFLGTSSIGRLSRLMSLLGKRASYAELLHPSLRNSFVKTNRFASIAHPSDTAQNNKSDESVANANGHIISTLSSSQSGQNYEQILREVTVIPGISMSSVESSHVRLFGKGVYAIQSHLARAAAKRIYRAGYTQRRAVSNDDSGIFASFYDFLSSIGNTPFSDILYRYVEVERQHLSHSNDSAEDVESKDAESLQDYSLSRTDASEWDADIDLDMDDDESLFESVESENKEYKLDSILPDLKQDWSAYLSKRLSLPGLEIPTELRAYISIESSLMPLALNYEDPMTFSLFKWTASHLLPHLAWHIVSNGTFMSSQFDVSNQSNLHDYNAIAENVFDSATAFALLDLTEFEGGQKYGVSKTRRKAMSSGHFFKALWQTVKSSFIFESLLRVPTAQMIVVPAQMERHLQEDIHQKLTRIVSIFIVFCLSYRESLKSVDDFEFFDKTLNAGIETSDKGRAGDAFVLDAQSHSTLVKALVAVIERIRIHSTWPPIIGSEAYSTSSRKNLVAPSLTSSLLSSANALLRDLWKRNLRRPFTNQQNWVFPDSTIHLLLNVDVGGDSAGYLLDAAQSIDEDETDEMQSASQASRHTPKMRTLATVIRETPFLISFRERLRLFQHFTSRSQTHSYARIVIDRRNILASALRAFSQPFREYGVSFINQMGLREEGVGGGVWKDFLTEFWRHVTAPQLGIFSCNEQGEFYPEPLFNWYPFNLNDPAATSLAVCLASSSTSMYGTYAPAATQLEIMRICGFLAGRGVTTGVLVSPRFARFFLQAVLGERNTIDDLPNRDNTLYKSLMKLRNSTDEEISSLELDNAISIHHHDRSEVALLEEVEEKEDESNGSLERVLRASPILNLNQYRIYCKKRAHHLMNTFISLPALAFRIGLRDALDERSLRLFNAQELSSVLGGNEQIDISDIRQNCEITGLPEGSPQPKWFWEILEEFDSEHRQLFLKFATGSPRGPLFGFSQLTPRLAVRFLTNLEALESLPTAATCFNLIRVPAYSSKAIMRAKLLYAFEANAGLELT